MSFIEINVSWAVSVMSILRSIAIAQQHMTSAGKRGKKLIQTTGT